MFLARLVIATMTAPFNKPATYRDQRGRWRTQSMFLEQSYGSTSQEKPVFTMKGEDIPETMTQDALPSFRRLYLEIGDPSEYRQAKELCGGWEHWQELLKSKWFTDYITDLRSELAVQLRSQGLMKLLEIMNGDDPNKAATIARYFADQDYREKRKPGRPSNEEVSRQAREIAESNQRVQRDAARLGLSVVPKNEGIN